MGNTSTSTVKWISLQPFPWRNTPTHLSKPIMIDPVTLLVVPQNNELHKTYGIYTYNMNKNKWKKEINYKSRHKIENHCIAFNKYTNTLYIYNNFSLAPGGKMMRINLHTKKWQINNCNIGDCTEACCVMANERFHIIGGFHSNRHYVWNEFYNKFKLLHTFKHITSGITGHRLIYLKQRQIILMFGGYEPSYNQSLDTVYCYSLKSTKWKRLKVKLPEPVNRFGCTAAMNDKYILFFGGGHGCFNYKARFRHIFIFNVEEKTFIRVKRKCPELALYHAVTIERQSILLICGYIWTFIKQRYPPMDIMNLISSFSGVEELEVVHLIGYGFRYSKHFKIKVIDII